MISYIAAPSRADDIEGAGRDLLMFFNSTGQTRSYKMPEVGRGMRWKLFIDTAAVPPQDIYPKANGPLSPADRVIEMPHHSLKLFVSQKRPV
jgi:glycogen operon protein